MLEPTSHARSACQLGTEAYAPIALTLASAALADSRGQTQKFPCISFARLLPPPLRRKAGNEGKEIFGLLRRTRFSLYQTGIFHNRLYRGSIVMSKKYQPKYQNLVKKLRQARHEAGLTQIEAGKRLKKPQAYISKIERGERGIDAVELAEFAKVYGKNVNYFL